MYVLRIYYKIATENTEIPLLCIELQYTLLHTINTEHLHMSNSPILA